jgi:hypothetical protein
MPPSSPGLGGAINEKALKRRANPELASLCHSTYGLDHYPNYLQRWDIAAIDGLECQLERQLALVKQQKAEFVERAEAMAKFESHMPPRDKKLCLHPTLLAAMAQTGGVLDAVSLSDLLNEVCPEVYEFRMFSLPFCEEILQECTRFSQFCSTTLREDFPEAPWRENMAKRLVPVLDRMGLSWLNDMLLEVVAPMATLLYEDDLKGSLDWRHGYVVGYAHADIKAHPLSASVVNRSSLISHTDDSEMTLNVGLGELFTGGELAFHGIRGTSQEGKVTYTTKIEIGMACIHLGRHLHEVLEVCEGRRYQLIMWTRSMSGVRSETCACCWMNRRAAQGSHCVCGPAWN